MITNAMKGRLAEIRDNVQVEVKVLHGCQDAKEVVLKTPAGTPVPRVVNEWFLLEFIHELEKQLWYLQNQDGAVPEEWEFGPPQLPEVRA